jgi:hypothetical protein
MTIDQKKDTQFAEDHRYYFKKVIEHDGDYCGPCKYTKNQICYFFRNLEKDTFNGKIKRHKRCLEAEEVNGK